MSIARATRGTPAFTGNDAAQQLDDYVLHLLRSHAPPPAHMGSLLSASSTDLTRIDSDIAACAAEMRRLKERRNHLVDRRAVLNAHINNLQGLFHPSAIFPPRFWSKYLRSVPPMSTAGCIPPAHPSTLGDGWRKLPYSRYRGIVLCPALWSSPRRINTMMGLLKAALDRSAPGPLYVTIENHIKPAYGPALVLPARHSARWVSATLKCLSSGNLPRLRTLNVEITGPPPAIDLFDDAPRLVELRAEGRINTLSAMPLYLAQRVSCAGVKSAADMARAVRLIAGLLSGTSFKLELDLDSEVQQEVSLSPAPSPISYLTVEVAGELDQGHCRRILGDFFDRMTLSQLKDLELHARRYTQYPLPFPSASFLALCERSAFAVRLRTLDLHDVVISETTLLQCLAALPSLVDLMISDHMRVEGLGINRVLITDSLLRALTRTPDTPCLVPRLGFFACSTRLRFNHNLLIAFVLSRLDQTPTDQSQYMFVFEIREIDEDDGQLSTAVYNRLDAEERLIFTEWSPDERDIMRCAEKSTAGTPVLTTEF
ncbi:hypothetical protein FB451DRAFT_1416831 [Mycena latifolia]|nr:hypothetical protein FB451DRAFT_1416831 [Mycena latifolia]